MKTELLELAKRFHLRAFVAGKMKIKDGLENEEYLLEMLRNEAKYREERAVNERIKKSCLPAEKKFDEFDCDWQKCVTKSQIETLAKLEWIDEAFRLSIPNAVRFAQY